MNAETIGATLPTTLPIYEHISHILHKCAATAVLVSNGSHYVVIDPYYGINEIHQEHSRSVRHARATAVTMSRPACRRDLRRDWSTPWRPPNPAHVISVAARLAILAAFTL